MSDYSKDMFRQLNEIMERCDKLDNKITDIRKEHKKEITKLKAEHKKEIIVLNDKIDTLTKENKSLKSDNARMKNILNNNSSNTSLPPSTDQKGKKSANEYNSRKKSDNKKGGQKGRKGTTLKKEDVEKEIKSGNFKHKVIDVGVPSKIYTSKYVIDLKVTVTATEYRFYEDESGVISIPAKFTSNVTYGPNIKAIAVDLNGEGFVSNDRITEFINTLTDGKLNISAGSIYGFRKEFQKKSN